MSHTIKLEEKNVNHQLWIDLKTYMLWSSGLGEIDLLILSIFHRDAKIGDFIIYLFNKIMINMSDAAIFKPLSHI